jgi:hypothetical protein
MGLIQPIGTLDRTISKTAIVNLANDHANQIIDGGHYDLLKTYVEMKRYELYIKTIINKLKTSSTYQARVMREEDQRPAPLPGQEIPADAGLMTNLPALTPLDVTMMTTPISRLLSDRTLSSMPVPASRLPRRLRMILCRMPNGTALPTRLLR